MTNQPDETADLNALIEIFRKDIAKFAKLVFNADLRPKQIEFANAFKDHRRVTFRGGTGFGKTFVLSILIWWSLICHDDVQVTLVGPSEDQLKNGSWKELRSLYDKMHPFFKDAFETSESKVWRKSAPVDCFAAYRLAPKDNPRVLAGIHKKNNFLFCDEASNISDEAFAALQGIMDDINPKMVLISNPARVDGYFYRTWNDESVSKNWQKIHGSWWDNPGSTEEKHQEKIAEFGGIDSRDYGILILGEFPETNADGLIPKSLIDLAVNNDTVILDATADTVWGLDPAGETADADRSVLAIRNENLLVDIKSWQGIKETQLAEIIASLYVKTPASERPAYIYVDVAGMGSPIARMLEDYYNLPVKRVNGANSPTRNKDRFNRLRDQLWWECKEWFATENVKIPNNSDLIKELTVPTYDTSNGKIKIESKDNMKKRMKGKSPDYADALCLTMMHSGSIFKGKHSFTKPIQYDNLEWYE